MTAAEMRAKLAAREAEERIPLTADEAWERFIASATLDAKERKIIGLNEILLPAEGEATEVSGEFVDDEPDDLDVALRMLKDVKRLFSRIVEELCPDSAMEMGELYAEIEGFIDSFEEEEEEK